MRASKFTGQHYSDLPMVLKLHLEINIEGADMEALRKYGKVEKGISRDVLVPADMDLHALHYVIMKLFGWRGYHMHKFEFPEKVRAQLFTDGESWLKYAGIYFRVPMGDEDDLYWDDDLSKGEDFDEWLREKYKAPYVYGGINEYLFMSRWNAEKIEFEEPFMVESRDGPFDGLIEKNCIINLLLPKGVRKSTTALKYLHEEIEDRREMYTKCLDGGLGDALTLYDIGRKMLTNETATEEDLDSYSEMHCGLGYVLSSADVIPEPISYLIDYKYDFGDGWEIAVTMDNVYSARFEDPDDTSTDYKLCDVKGAEIDSALLDNVMKVINKGRPMCVAADGLSVVEDAGAIWGYCQMLRSYNGEVLENSGYEDPESTADWALSQGWRGRKLRTGFLM